MRVIQSTLWTAMLGFAVTVDHIAVTNAQQGNDDNNNSCCTWNYKACGTNEWCNESASNCEACTGFWQDVTGNDSCKGRSDWANSPEDCCGDMTLVHFEEHNYVGCGVAGRDGEEVTSGHADENQSCCSWNYKTCGSNEWCNAHSINCGSCTGFWTTVALNDSCKGRSDWANNPDDCCGDMTLVYFAEHNFVGCGVPGRDGEEAATGHADEDHLCCSSNFKTCVTSEWCGAHSVNCEGACNSFWTDVQANTNCNGRYEWSPSSDDCCADMILVHYSEHNYVGCGVSGRDGAPLPTSAPTQSPVASPTASPSLRPTFKPTTRPPTSSPTVLPTSSPTSTPTTTHEPTSSPSLRPTRSPVKSASPTRSPTLVPTVSIATCCTWDLKTCGTNAWCGANGDNCGNCNGFWQTVAGADADCLPRWQGIGAAGGSPCCDGMLLVQFDGYIGCGVEGVDGTPLPQPTVSPSAVPTTAVPTFQPTEPWPTLSPFHAPTQGPLESGNPILPLPSGPFVAPGYSERVVIPQPAFPREGIYVEGYDCPHQQPDLVTWNALGLTPSSEWANVRLPAATKVLVTASIPIRLGIVEVPADSELILDSNPDGIEMHMRGMKVEGKLVAGSHRCRIQTPITLTFHGARPADAVWNVPGPEIKGISVSGGEISLHGKRFYRTWTRLAKTVEAGERVLMLQDEVNWVAGQEIVLVTTAVKDSREWHENEVHEIEYVYPNVPTGAALQLKNPVQHRHMGFNNYQAEVGLLSRTIKIQGAEDSEATDPDPMNCVGKDYYGDTARPCAGTHLTGYGAHIIIHNGGVGQVEGVELYRVGQTNVLGRYPIHFHFLGSCPSCYFKDSSVHRSFFRCIAIHATNDALFTENVAYDVTGFCYYLEDGVETGNTISYNLAAHIHMLGDEPPTGIGQTIPIVSASNDLILPADIAASGFYISNINNNVIGNTASGGWAGFAFPVLSSPVGLSQNVNMRPSSALPLTIDGNTAHSTGWWWNHAGAFYFGGALYYEDNVLKYDAGRALGRSRNTCKIDLCAQGDCNAWCPHEEWEWVRVTNTKAYLVAGVGVNSWNGRMEFVGFESHDNSRAIEALAAGFWIDDMLAVCRSGEPLTVSATAQANRMSADGFFWYDTSQEHIITDSTFRKCGYRSDAYNQYDTDPNRGCADDASMGCNRFSTVFGFLTHSDQFVPEIMQGTSGISFEQCGRRFRLRNFRGDGISSVSGRTQNWDDVDGTASGLNVPTIMGSGDPACGLWWTVDDSVVDDPQGPLKFIKRTDGVERGLGHIHMEWDDWQHNQVGSSLCGNGNNAPCPALGYIRHAGSRFANDSGLPVTANADIVGPVGGYGWYLELLNGAPKTLTLSLVEVDPSTPLVMSIAYPPGTAVTITAHAQWCYPTATWSCEETFTAVSSVQEIRESEGNKYHMSSDGVLTFRVVQPTQSYTGLPNWALLTWSDKLPNSERYSLMRFERKNVRLPMMSYGPWLTVESSCASNGAYCAGSIATSVQSTVDNVCPGGYEQVAYDRCCDASMTNCVFANGVVG